MSEKTKTLIDFKYGDDTYSIVAKDYPNELFYKEKFQSVYEPTHNIDIYSFDVTDDVAFFIKKNGEFIKELGEHWAGGKVTEREFVENVMTMYCNGLEKSSFAVTSACDEIQQIKAYYDNTLDNGNYFVSFRDNEIYHRDIESKKYVGYIYSEDCIMLNKNDMTIVTDFPEFYIETVQKILDDCDEDILYFDLSSDELRRTAINGEIKCEMSFFENEELDLTEQAERGR